MPEKNPPRPRPAATAGTKRPPMERMWRIHQEVSGGGYPNCRRLSVELEVSAKTVMRDIEFMRDRLGLPLEYDAVKHGRSAISR